VDRLTISSQLGPRTARINGRLQVDPVFSKVVAHELGHGVGIRHHGDGDVRQLLWRVDDRGLITEQGSPIRLLREDRTPMKFPSLAVGRSITIWLGVKGGEHSGDQACFMRYGTSLAYRSATEANVRYWADPPEVVGGGLCSAKTGTGVNQAGRVPQARYGDASNGNCQGQIRVRDQ
jgi:hypothetical protein